MKRAIRRIALALFSAVMVFASFSVFAAEIVIDSGDSATIISSLPDSAAQEEPVCSDTFNGILGKCSGPAQGILGFYHESTQFPETDIPLRVQTICDPGDIATGGGVVVPFGQLGEVEVLESGPRSDFDAWQASVSSITEGQSATLVTVCADYFPAHEK